jgi:ABC-2 type transport system permease protein
MSGLRVTFGKELLSHFYSPVSYLIAVLFYLWHGALVSYVAQIFALQRADRELFPTQCYGLQSTMFMVVLVPGILTMRCFAEERRTGSIETLMTAPVSDLGVVLGKWLAAVAFFLLLWLPTVLLLWVMTWSPFLDTSFATGPVFAAYLGMFLLSGLLLAFGCFASSLTDNLLLAAIVAILFNFALLQVPSLLRQKVGDPKEHPLLAQLVEQLDVAGNFTQWFARGLIDTGQIWFYVGGMLFFLFLTVQTFSARRVEGGFRLRTLGSWLNLGASTALMLGVWVLLIWVGGRPALRTLIDMTPGARASVDPLTAELLHGLEAQDVKVDFHAFLMTYGGNPEDPRERQRVANLQRLQELTKVLLKQYDYLGGDATTVYVYDQTTDPDLERQARQRLGTSDTDIVVVAVKQPGKAPRTRKLSLEGDFAVIDIPELQPGRNGLPTVPVPILKDFRGEQALSSALKGLLVEGTPVVYVLNGFDRGKNWLSTAGDGYSEWARALTSSGFEVRQLSLATSHGAVPRDAAMVAVLEPTSEFTTQDIDALDNYVRRGGRLFLDYSWFPFATELNLDGGELGHRLGFEVGRQPVFHRVEDGSPEGLDGIRHVTKLDLLLNTKHPITQRLWTNRQHVLFDMARPLVLRRDAPPGLRIEPLLSTGPNGWLGLSKGDGEPDYTAPRVAGAMHEFTAGLVVEVDGEKPGDKPGSGDKPPPGRVVVTSGMFCNNVGIGVAGNGDFALNICNWLGERRVLLDIHGSGYKADYFTLDERRKGNVTTLLWCVPLAFLLSGLTMFFLRRRL